MSFPKVDVLVVGAGVLGLCHAVAAVERGLSVAVVERDDRCVGASVRNFGHVSITAQSGRVLDLGRASRSRWLDLARRAGFWAGESGTVVLARAEDEAGVLEELADARGPAEVRLVPVDRLATHLPGYDERAWLAAYLPLDLRVDPREAIPAVAAWLAEQGVTFHWGTTVAAAADGTVWTSRGELAAERVVLCVDRDIDRLLPELADSVGLVRCLLQMLEVEPPWRRRLEPAVLSGSSMVRYPAMAGCPSADLVRKRLEDEHPEILEHGINLMVTSRPDGGLVIGDSHHYSRTETPFDRADIDHLLLREAALLLGVPGLVVRQRWRGVYASAPATQFVEHDLDPRTRAVAVTSGIGMTTAPALAEVTAATW